MTTTLTEPGQRSDAELVACSLASDRDAYAAIVQRHQSLVCAITYSACGDVHQSEDLAQETFLAAWKSLRDLKDPAQLRPWLRGVARNIVRGALRKQGRAPATQNHPEDDSLASTVPGPDEASISREEEA